MSKDAADPNDPRAHRLVEASAEQPAEPAPQAAAPAPAPTTPSEPSAMEASHTFTQMEVSFFELSKENVLALQGGRVLRDDGDWRVVYFEDGKSIESLRRAAGRLPGDQSKPIQKESPNLEVDAGDLNPDMQSPYLAVGVDWLKNESLHWAVDLQTPVISGGAGPRNVASAVNAMAPTATPPGTPTPLQATALEGDIPFKPQGALLLIYDPPNRGPANVEVNRLAQSPLKILASDDFRMGYSDLIVWIRAK